MYGKCSYIITRTEQYCTYQVRLHNYDDVIMVLKEPHEYEYFITADTRAVTNILILRILEELYQSDVTGSYIRLIDIDISPQMSQIISLLSACNQVTVEYTAEHSVGHVNHVRSHRVISKK